MSALASGIGAGIGTAIFPGVGTVAGAGIASGLSSLFGGGGGSPAAPVSSGVSGESGGNSVTVIDPAQANNLAGVQSILGQFYGNTTNFTTSNGIASGISPIILLGLGAAVLYFIFK